MRGQKVPHEMFGLGRVPVSVSKGSDHCRAASTAEVLDQLTARQQYRDDIVLAAQPLRDVVRYNRCART